MDVNLTSRKKGVFIDYSELNAAVARTAAAGVVITGHTVTTVARELVKKIEQKTPVKTGRARSGWYKAVVGLGGSWSDRGSDPAQIALGKSEGGFSDRTINKYRRDIVIENNVPYIDKLEHGYSLQAPAGMVKISALEMEGKLTNSMIEGYKVAWNKRSGIMKVSRGATSGKNPNYKETT